MAPGFFQPARAALHAEDGALRDSFRGQPAAVASGAPIKIKTGQNSQRMTEMPGEFSNSTTGDYGDYMIAACTNGNQIFLWANKEQRSLFARNIYRNPSPLCPMAPGCQTFFSVFLCL
jgi:hypothetical protein